MSCPSDTNATVTACSANSCLIGACGAGFSPNAAGTTCVMTGPIFSGAPVAIVQSVGRFAVSLAGDGNALVVGDEDGGGGNGSATVYTRSVGIWSVGTNVTRPSYAGNFGISVSLSHDGNTLVVGDDAGDGGPGSATVYTRSAGMWSVGTNVNRLTGAPGGGGDFGTSVSLSQNGNTLVVGDDGGGNFDGSATVYTRSGGTWSAGTSVNRPSGAAYFGRTVSLSQDGRDLVVGDYGGGGGPGSVNVYTRSGGTWPGSANITRPSDAGHFGYCVSLSQDGNTLVVGDYGGSDLHGSATIYTRSGGTWSVGTNVTRPSGAGNFGTSLSLSQDGDTLVVGDGAGDGGPGSATVFTRTGGTWSAGTNVTRPGGATNFGTSVSLSQDGNTLVVGSSRAVHVYTR